jgi:hypothetical protein
MSTGLDLIFVCQGLLFLGIRRRSLPSGCHACRGVRFPPAYACREHRRRSISSYHGCSFFIGRHARWRVWSPSAYICWEYYQRSANGYCGPISVSAKPIIGGDRGGGGGGGGFQLHLPPLRRMTLVPRWRHRAPRIRLSPSRQHSRVPKFQSGVRKRRCRQQLLQTFQRRYRRMHHRR